MEYCFDSLMEFIMRSVDIKFPKVIDASTPRFASSEQTQYSPDKLIKYFEIDLLMIGLNNLK